MIKSCSIIDQSEHVHGGLSIIIPNYNHGHYLTDAIRSRLQQTLPPQEVIVVDDGSTDNSVMLINRECARDSRVRLIRRDENGGPNAAIASGLSVTCSEFVMFSAADDQIEPNFTEHALAALKRFPQAAFCFMDSHTLCDITKRIQIVPLALATAPTYFSPDLFERLMRRNFFTISSNTVVYRRTAIETAGGFRLDLDWQADWLANLVLAFRYGACYVPKSLATLRLSHGTYSWRGLRQQAEQRRLLYRSLDLLAQEYSDVFPRFRRAALLPEMRARDLFWLITSPRHRRYITLRLSFRLFAREFWMLLRPILPLCFRRWLRRRASDMAVLTEIFVNSR